MLLMNFCSFVRIYSGEREKSNDAHFTIDMLIIREDRMLVPYVFVRAMYFFLQFDILVLLLCYDIFVM
jgi:hypothetical protein